MKIQNILAAAIAVGTMSSAVAQTTEITVTGATAFRQATLKAIFNAYDSVGNVGVNFNIAHDFNGNTSNQVSQLIASNKAVFIGPFPGITGTTIIRTSFNGSVEGLSALANTGNATTSFLQTSTATSSDNGTANGNTANDGIRVKVTSPTELLRPKFSFSDVFQSTTPVDSIALEPADAKVGVVTFAMVANESAPANFTNVTNQQARQLWASGVAKLRLFTGNATDTTRVFATGRNDGSGTRSAYLTEWTYGVSNGVQQYITTTAGEAGNGTITAITLVPAGGTGTGNLTTADGSGNASTLWGNNVLGNGGYRSSSALRGIMGRTSASVSVYNGVSQTPTLTAQPIILLTWLSTSDSLNAQTAGAKILAYNGVSVTPLATADPNNYLGSGFNQADFNKITQGAYSAWSYQQLYHWGSLTDDEQAWRDAMTAPAGYLEVGLSETANGVTLSDMNAERPDDGFPIGGF